MGDRPPAPGYDEITVAKPPGRSLCSKAEHRRLYVLAEVVITFGELGVAWQKDALWFTNWHRSFTLCRECSDTVVQVARTRRPGLTVTDTSKPRSPEPGLAVSDPETA